MATRTPELVKSGDFNVIGKRPIRHDGVDKVTGRAAYGADIFLPGMLYGKVLRSPHAHATIMSIDTSKAEAIPGVHAVVTYTDLPEPGEGMTELNESGEQATYFKAYNMLAREKVLYDGHAIAAVAATDPHIAEDAVRRIEVEYEHHPPIMNSQQAIDSNGVLLLPDIFTDTEGEIDAAPSNITKHVIYEEGDIEAGFAAADVVVDNRIRDRDRPPGIHRDSQRHGALARGRNARGFGAAPRASLESARNSRICSRCPYRGLRSRRWRSAAEFGGKTTIYIEILAALLSKKTDRPVKMTMDLAEVLKATGPTPGTWEKAKIGATKDGKITAAHVTLYFEAGAFPGSPLAPGCMTALSPYSLKNFRIDGYEVLVNKPHSHAYRAPGSTMSEFAVETAVDEICETLDMDPLKFRLLNASKEGRLAGGRPAVHASRQHRMP